MYHKKKQKKLEIRYVILLILLSITLILGGTFFAFKDTRPMLILERGVKDAGTFVLKILYTPIRFVNDAVATEKEKNKIYKTYHDMQEKYDSINTISSELTEAQKEIADLEGMLELNATMTEKTYVNATVVARDIGYWYDTLTLDKGTRAGIEVGQAVINQDGLLGYISASSMFSSTVKLLTSGNENHKVSIKIEVGDSFVYGLLTGYDSEKNLFRIEGISENTGIPKNAKVTTTGLGNQFPSGILVGTVSDIMLDHFELAKTVYMTPSVNFNDTHYVSVLKRELDS